MSTEPKPFKSPGSTRPGDEPETNKNGATVLRTFHPMIDRYRFDFDACSPDDEWEQYDTDQDFSHFGVWVRISTRESVTYAEGDITHVVAPDEDTFKAELAQMAEFYGEAPPAFRVITRDGQLIEAFGARPGEEGPSGTELLAQALND